MIRSKEWYEMVEMVEGLIAQAGLSDAQIDRINEAVYMWTAMFDTDEHSHGLARLRYWAKKIGLDDYGWLIEWYFA